MKVSELRDKIVIRVNTADKNTTEFTATLTVSTTYTASSVELFQHAEIEPLIRERLHDDLLRCLYDDQRRELMELIHEFRCCDQFNYEKQIAVVGKMMLIIRHQPLKP